MDANQRLVLTIALCLAILLGFQFIFGDPFAPPEPEETPAAETEAPVARAPAQGEREGPALDREEAPSRPDLPIERAELRTESLALTLSSRGAGIEKVELLGPKGRRQGKDAEQVDLAAGLRPEDPLLFELRGRDGLPDLGGAACRLANASDESVSFRCEQGALRIDKRFTLTGDRTLELVAELHNRGSSNLEGTLDLVVPARVDPQDQGGGGCGGLGRGPNTRTELVCRHGDDLTQQVYSAKEPIVTPQGMASFAGIEERYFLAVAVPTMQGKISSCELVGAQPDFLTSHLLVPTGAIAPGARAEFRWDLVLGQKGLRLLQDTSAEIAAKASIANPELEETVDLGFWAAIARILQWLLRLFHGMIPNWGVAIILLTLLVKIVTLPLTWKSMQSMEAVRQLAPEIEKLRKKYGDDREKLNMEMMQLYQRHKVNPLGGCLPMLIQMPIWLALYTTLLTSVELYNEPFIGGWISDLTSKDPYYILPLAMGATMFLTQKLQPMQGDPTQQKMLLYFMPIFFTFIMLQLPAGLTLYIFTNNVLSIGQQLVMRKMMAKNAPAAPASAATVDVDVEKKGEKRRKDKGKKGRKETE